MSGLLAVGDMHLKETVILPLVDQALKDLEVDTIVLMGDYLDEWQQETNATRYREEMSYLVHWVATKREKMNVICLLGNHDIPYLTKHYRHYSTSLPNVRDEAYLALKELSPQLYYLYNDWLFTHAGAVGEGVLPFDAFDHLEIGTSETEKLLDHLEKTAGSDRGGVFENGSIVWADYKYNMKDGFNSNYPKQIVGHTPISNIDIWNNIIDIDTFSLTRDGLPIGNGSLLYFEGEEPKVILTDYVNQILKG